MEPVQSFDHTLESIKGWPNPYALDKVAAVEETEADELIAGMVVSLNASGKFVRGQGNQAMPLYCRSNGDDYDVASIAGGTAGRTFGSDGPTVMALAGTGAFELETTEFIAGNYLPNQPLRSGTAASSGVNAGKVVQAHGYYIEDVCGVVSAVGPLTNPHRKQVVRFWSYFLPANPVNQSLGNY